MHTYSDSGIYSVTLVIGYNTNCGTKYKKTSIELNLAGGCTAHFGYDINEQTYEVSFYDLSIASNNQYIYKWEWDFGDDNTSNYQNPTHTYLNGGKYEVKLKITDTDECTKTVKKNIYFGIDTTCLKNYKYKCKIPYDGGNYKLKCKFKISTIINGKLKAKAVNLKVKNNGSNKREKANEIGAGFAGKFYYGKYCDTTASLIDKCELREDKKSAKKKWTNWGEAIRVQNNEISATFYVKNKNEVSFSKTIKLKDDCP